MVLKNIHRQLIHSLMVYMIRQRAAVEGFLSAVEEALGLGLRGAFEVHLESPFICFA